ncbi:MAG TPA: DUF2784 domain-containing protein [Nitrospirales bacterium]|nr:DUF2784 domain-containing protein [Nitrospirales bacterium]
MLYRLLADATALVHFAFVLFVALGGFLVLRWHKLAWIHLPAAIWGALIEIENWLCPLTKWENLFRERAGMHGYSEGFIAHHIYRLIYPPGLTRGIQLAIAAFVFTVNIVIYTAVTITIRRSRRA